MIQLFDGKNNTFAENYYVAMSINNHNILPVEQSMIAMLPYLLQEPNSISHYFDHAKQILKKNADQTE